MGSNNDLPLELHTDGAFSEREIEMPIGRRREEVLGRMKNDKDHYKTEARKHW